MAGRSSVGVILLRHLHRRHFSASTADTPLQRSIRISIENRDCLQIPHLLLSHSYPNPNPNPFSFLYLLPPTLTARIIGDLLQSFLPLRPRSLTSPAYSSLLALTLSSNPNPNPNPLLLLLALPVLQSSLRSGLPLPPSTHLSLSLSWLHLRRRRSPSSILSSLIALGFRLDLNTCNYLISSLCSSSEFSEAVEILNGMAAAGIDPDSESYCTVIEAMGAEGEGILREMVAEIGMAPRKGTVVRVVKGMRKAGDVRRAAELVRFLEMEGCVVGFEGYKAVAEGCLEKGEIVMAARVVAEMVTRGFIPDIGMRRRVVEGLARIGRGEIAAELRRRLAEIGC